MACVEAVDVLEDLFLSLMPPARPTSSMETTKLGNSSSRNQGFLPLPDPITQRQKVRGRSCPTSKSANQTLQSYFGGIPKPELLPTRRPLLVARDLRSKQPIVPTGSSSSKFSSLFLQAKQSEAHLCPACFFPGSSESIGPAKHNGNLILKRQGLPVTGKAQSRSHTSRRPSHRQTRRLSTLNDGRVFNRPTQGSLTTTLVLWPTPSGNQRG